MKKSTEGLFQHLAKITLLLILFAGCGLWITVEEGDTIYSIARANNMAVDDILNANPNIKDPDKIHVGQKIRIPRAGGSPPSKGKPRGTATGPTHKPAHKTKMLPDTPAAATPMPVKTPDLTKTTERTTFIWPCTGTLIRFYGRGPEGKLNEGIDIAAPAGSHIVAAADGEVVLINNVSESDPGNEKLKAWGNIVVLLHANKYVTLYAHNRVNLVIKGAKIKQGEIIAEVGDTGRAKQPLLHFQVRRNKGTIDPLKVLPK